MLPLACHNRLVMGVVVAVAFKVVMLQLLPSAHVTVCLVVRPVVVAALLT